MRERTIVLTTSCANDFISPDERFVHNRVHVGREEAFRLLGKDENYGNGPLPLFLKQARAAQREGKQTDLLFCEDQHDPNDPHQQSELLRYGHHSIIETEGAQLVEPVRDIAREEEMIFTKTLALPLRTFHEKMRGVLGKDILDLTYQEREKIMWIVAGSHTNIRVLDILNKLRNEYQFRLVFVCPHLVSSRDQQAHMTTLQTTCPDKLIGVEPNLQRLMERAGIINATVREEIKTQWESCNLIQEGGNSDLSGHQREITERLFLFYSRVNLRSLKGGFSGSKLFLAQARTAQGAHAKPVVVKIDSHAQMYRELTGYHRIKDLLGKHLPSFGTPITLGDQTGIKMELASMHGEPKTLQGSFEVAETEEALQAFIRKLNSALEVLRKNLYENTKKTESFRSTESFGLQEENQKKWLRENVGHILSSEAITDSTWTLAEGVVLDNSIAGFDRISVDTSTQSSETSLCHGDLNFANLISDAHDNISIIDFTDVREAPIELDFAKMENDIKFVLNKSLTEEDLPNLQVLETFFLSHVALPSIDELSESLAFVREDMRFRKVYEAVRTIRDHYRQARSHTHTLYHQALLKYAVHTLSFDRRRGRGECDLPQLKYALLSTALLTHRINTQNE